MQTKNLKLFVHVHSLYRRYVSPPKKFPSGDPIPLMFITICQRWLQKLLIHFQQVIFRQDYRRNGPAWIDQLGTGVLQEKKLLSTIWWNHFRILIFLCSALIFNCDENHTDWSFLVEPLKISKGRKFDLHLYICFNKITLIAWNSPFKYKSQKRKFSTPLHKEKWTASLYAWCVDDQTKIWIEVTCSMQLHYFYTWIFDTNTTFLKSE